VRLPPGRRLNAATCRDPRRRHRHRIEAYHGHGGGEGMGERAAVRGGGGFEQAEGVTGWTRVCVSFYIMVLQSQPLDR